MQYTPDVHNRQSIRMRDYDYRTAGAYFVTICTFERACILGDPAMTAHLEQTWRAVGKYNRCARGEDFVVMPNHVHGIIRITRRDPVSGTDAPAPIPVPVLVGAQHVRDQTFGRLQDAHLARDGGPNTDVLRPYNHDRTRPYTPYTPGTRRGEPDRPVVLPGSLGAFVRAFKSASAKRINALRGAASAREAPVWQRGYFERIIRDGHHLATARQYILDNPAKWAEDPNNPSNFACAPVAP